MKVAQVVAEEFQIDIDRVKITATTTAKVPNTAPTAASSGADLNGMAAQDAARQIKKRLIRFAAQQYQVPEDQIMFLPNRVRVGNQEISFNDLVKPGLYRPCAAFGGGPLQDTENPLGPREGPRPCLLLLRLWRGLFRG